jgi:hypothetical protein
MQKHRDKHNQ